MMSQRLCVVVREAMSENSSSATYIFNRRRAIHLRRTLQSVASRAVGQKQTALLFTLRQEVCWSLKAIGLLMTDSISWWLSLWFSFYLFFFSFKIQSSVRKTRSLRLVSEFQTFRIYCYKKKQQLTNQPKDTDLGSSICSLWAKSAPTFSTHRRPRLRPRHQLNPNLHIQAFSIARTKSSSKPSTRQRPSFRIRCLSRWTRLR